MTQEDIGLNSDAKEAVVFVLLASDAINGNCNNVRVVANRTNIFGREKLLQIYKRAGQMPGPLIYHNTWLR